MVSKGSHTRFTLRHEDMCFLLDHRTTAMFGETTISGKNRDREWEKFVKRNGKKGLVPEYG